jgi:hypothetical protein
MSRYDHKIEPSLEGIEHLSKEMKMKIKKMKNSKTTDKKWELKMKENEPLQSWIVNIMSSTKPFY